MTRRRQSRRRHRAERRERDPVAPSPTPAVAPSPRHDTASWFTDVSYTGLLGGVTGVLALGQSAVYLIVVNPDDVSPLRAIPVFAAAAVYLPAVWVSVRPTPNRRKVLRAVLAVTLVLMVLGAVLSDPAYFGLLLIPSSLLAIAAGMLFNRPPRA
jgi:hypothetical protein